MILPIDHGTAIPVPGLEDPRELIGALNESVDGYVVNMGVANAFADALEGKGLCFRTDVYKPAAAGNPTADPMRSTPRKMRSKSAPVR